MDGVTQKITAWLKHYHDDLSFNSAGMCYLDVDKQLEVVLTLSMDKRYILMYSPIFSAATGNDFSLALEALSLNLYQDIAQYGVLAHDDQTNKIVYTLVIEDKPEGQAELFEEKFHALLEGFITNSQMLIQRFDQLQSRVPKTAVVPSFVPQARSSSHLNGGDKHV